MKTKVEDIKRIIASKKARLEALAQPGMWIRYTKNMECGEIREFKQSCIDDEIIIEALEKQIPKKFELWNGQCACPNCNKLFGDYSQLKTLIHWEMPYCKFCGQALDWSDPTEKGGAE